ncbi:unnamed protein product, partial [Ixodes hexagonus]
MLVTECDDAGDGLEDVRYLFEACHLGPKNDTQAAGRGRCGTSFDDGYASSSSREDDLETTGLVAGLTAISIDDDAVLRRGPTRTRDDRTRPQPYYGHQPELHDDHWRDDLWGAYTVLPSSPPKPSWPSSETLNAAGGGLREWTTGSPLSQPSPVQPLSVESNVSSSPPLDVFALGCSPGNVDPREPFSSSVPSSSNLNALSRDVPTGQPHQELADNLGALLLAEPAEPDCVNDIERYLRDEAPLVRALPELKIEEVMSVLPAVPTLEEQTTQPPTAPSQLQVLKPPLEVTQTVQSNLRRYTPILPKDANTSPRAEEPAQAPARRQRQSRVERDALRAVLDVFSLNRATLQVWALRSGGQLRDRSPKRKSTYMHLAVQTDNSAFLLRLVDTIAKHPEEGLHVDVQDSEGHTPLHHACMRGQPTIVGFLCEAGARTDIESVERQRPLHLAAQYGELPCVAKLLQAAEPGLDAQDSKGRTALHWAVLVHKGIKKGPSGDKQTIDSIPVVKELISHGACLLVQDVVGETALHYAVAQKKTDMVE